MTENVNLNIKLPAPLRTEAQAVAKLRGESISEVVRAALKAYIAEALEDARDNRELDSLARQIAAGEVPTLAHADVWAEIERLQERGALPA